MILDLVLDLDLDLVLHSVQGLDLVPGLDLVLLLVLPLALDQLRKANLIHLNWSRVAYAHQGGKCGIVR